MLDGMDKTASGSGQGGGVLVVIDGTARNTADVEVWAAPLVEQKAWVLHLPSGVVGQAVRLWGPGESFPSGDRITVHALELDTGDRFIADPEAFTVLTDMEVAYLSVVNEAMRRAVGSMVALAAGEVQRKAPSAVSLPRAVQLLGSVLATQLRALRATGQGEEPLK